MAPAASAGLPRHSDRVCLRGLAQPASTGACSSSPYIPTHNQHMCTTSTWGTTSRRCCQPVLFRLARKAHLQDISQHSISLLLLLCGCVACLLSVCAVAVDASAGEARVRADHRAVAEGFCRGVCACVLRAACITDSCMCQGQQRQQVVVQQHGMGAEQCCVCECVSGCVRIPLTAIGHNLALCRAVPRYATRAAPAPPSSSILGACKRRQQGPLEVP